MGGSRRIKPVLYLVMACASLYTLTRFIDPLLELRQKGLGGESTAGMLKSVLGSDAHKALGEQAGGDLANLRSLLSGAGAYSAVDGGAAPTEPREIVVRDVRYVDDPQRAGRELFTQAMQLHSSGQLAEAEALYHRILEADPNDTGVHRNLAVLCCQQKRYAESWKHVHALRSLGRDMPEGFLAVLQGAMPDPAASGAPGQ